MPSSLIPAARRQPLVDLLSQVPDQRKDHGRRTRRTVKAVLAPAWAEFDGAAQVAQVRRTVTRKGKKTVEVVYVITSDADADADAATLAAWIQEHWHIENNLHWVRHVTYQEDKSLLRTGNAPRVMASLPGHQPAPARPPRQHRRSQPPPRPRPPAHAHATSICVNATLPCPWVRTTANSHRRGGAAPAAALPVARGCPR